MRLSNRIVEAGYARPMIIPFETAPKWNAPRLIKMLGVEEDMPSTFLAPRTIFAAQIIGPTSGEPAEQLRGRVGLRDYYEVLDTFAVTETGGQAFCGNEPTDGDGYCQ